MSSSFRPPRPAHAQTEGQPPSTHIALRRSVVFALSGAVAALGLVTAGSLGYLIFKDEALHALGARQEKAERTYEDHVALLRRELEKVNSQRVMEGAALEARVRELSARQSQIEHRALVLSALASGAGVPPASEQSLHAASAPTRTPLPPPRPAAAQANITPPMPIPSTLSFAPAARSGASPALDALQKASPGEGAPATADPSPPPLRGLRGALLSDEALPQTEPTAEIGPARNLAAIVQGLDRIEAMQVGIASSVGHRARREALRLELIASNLGLRPERLLASAPATGAEGGPFVPLKLDPHGSPFDRELLRHQEDVTRAARLRRALATVPVGRPVSDAAEQTSGFGSRIDPFLGRPAQHTGVDFREAHGAPVFASAAGKVVGAGFNGGYGLMVEIDHGRGITTRYAHLSSLLVEEGRTVVAGQSIGRIGSTGRSTGPHLHYEVRIDDEPVDPSRFLRAGVALANSGIALPR